MSSGTPDHEITEWLLRDWHARRERDMAILARPCRAQLQAVIHLDALRAELRRRLEMIRRQRPFHGKSIGTFCGPAQAPAIQIKESTAMETKKTEMTPEEMGGACRAAFGEHPEDVINILDSASETFTN